MFIIPIGTLHMLASHLNYAHIGFRLNETTILLCEYVSKPNSEHTEHSEHSGHVTINWYRVRSNGD